jgi:DNA-binding NarL/FixJ family response regulator
VEIHTSNLAFGPIRTLLVDHSEVFLRALTRYLERYSEVCIVGAAHTPDEALFRFERVQADVVLMELPTAGSDMFSRIRERFPNLRIIVLSALARDDYRSAIVALGADDYIDVSRLQEQLIPVMLRRSSSGPD